MATKAASSKASASTPRPSAVVEFDFDEAMEDSEIPTSQRRSKWDDQLDRLYEATEAGNVPTDDEGNFKFVKIGEWGNSNGARAQERTFEDKGYDGTYDFRSVRKESRSILYARVKTVAEESADADAEG